MIDVTSVTITANEVAIKGVDLDSIWIFNEELDENSGCEEIAYKFDISLAGARKYLYLVTKNNKKANEFKCSIWVEIGTRRINAKSLLGILSLGIIKGTDITIIADGADEEAAVTALIDLVQKLED